MKLLLHCCCALCLDPVVVALRDEFGDRLDLHLWFSNPNIHPLIEFRKRLKAVQVLNERLKLPLTLDERYDLDGYLRKIWKQGVAGRCERCYEVRLNACARAAAESGMSHFSTTLCVSRMQNHEAIQQVGEKAAQDAGVAFLYRDWRSYQMSVPRRPGIYAQQYCGCMFSEVTRYRDTKKELYRGGQNG